MNWRNSAFPSLKRRGGCASKKKTRSNRSGADGVVILGKCCFLKRSPGLTTPSAPSKVASQHFFEGAATPPLRGGEHPRLHFIHSFFSQRSKIWLMASGFGILGSHSG